MGERPDAEVLRQRLAEIRERLPGPNIHTSPYVGSGFSRTVCGYAGSGFSRTFCEYGVAGFSRSTEPCNQHRNKLARMIGARRAWIVAMIGGDHEQV